MTGLGPVTAVPEASSPNLVVTQCTHAFAPTRTTTPPSGVFVRIDSGQTRLNCGAIHFQQAPEKTNIFESDSIWTKGGWKETRGVRRPISGQRPVSESRMTQLNPFETKRKKAPSGTSSRVCDWYVAEEVGLAANVLWWWVITARPGIPSGPLGHNLEPIHINHPVIGDFQMRDHRQGQEGQL